MTLEISLYFAKVDENKVQNLNCYYDDPRDKFIYHKSGPLCSLIERKCKI